MTTLIDTVIYPDRSVRPPYPSFVKRVIVPELERTGPARYDLMTDLEVTSCAVKPPFKILTAEDVGNLLINDDLLRTCLGIHDGVTIQTRGLKMFRAVKEHYKIDEIYLWRSMMSDGPKMSQEILFGRPENFLPVILEQNGLVVIEWRKFSDCKWFKWVNIVCFAETVQT